MKTKLALAFLFLCTGGAFVLGWWPEHQQRLELEQQLGKVKGQLATSQSAAEICSLQNRLLSLLDLLHASNYAAAQTAASAFFDAVRADQGRFSGSSQLSQILAQRDGVIVALSRSDSSVEDTLRAMRGLLAQMQTQQGADATAEGPAPTP